MGARRTERNWDVELRRGTDVRSALANRRVFPGKKRVVSRARRDAVVMVGDTVVERALPGALLGELALIEQAVRSATVTATTDCQFLPIDARRFQFLVQQTPNFALHVMRTMADRLRRADLLLLERKADANPSNFKPGG
jgi:CRP-like cAMP-binding protein